MILHYFRKCSCSDLLPTKLHALPSPYFQLGASSNLADLKNIFYEASGLLPNEIRFMELFWTRESPNSCQPYNEVINIPEEAKIFILYKKQTCSTEDHSYSVVAILIKNALQPDILQSMEDLLFSTVLPRIKFAPRGSTDAFQGCDCNKRTEAGGTKSFGCARCKINPKVCKFYKLSKIEEHGRKQYDLQGRGRVNDPDLKKLIDTAADITSVNMEKFAPVAFSNLLNHAQKGRECTIGSASTKIFGGITIVSDYSAHLHRDAFDLPQGAVGIISFKNPRKIETQFHALPHYVSNPNNAPGVCFDPGHNSLLLEVAVHEDHASTFLKHPDSKNPSRIALVLYRHESLDKPNHGAL